MARPPLHCTCVVNHRAGSKQTVAVACLAGFLFLFTETFCVSYPIPHCRRSPVLCVLSSATVFETVGGGGGIADNSEEKNYEMVQPSFSRQQSTSSDDVEMARGRGLRRRRSHQRDEEKNNLSLVSVHTPLFRVPPRPEEPDPPRDANDQAPWPGSEFEVAKVLPDSVYLWACGEGGDQVPREKPVSTAGCLAAWVVLIVRNALSDCDSASIYDFQLVLLVDAIKRLKPECNPAMTSLSRAYKVQTLDIG